MLTYNQIKKIYSWNLPKIIFGIGAVGEVGVEARQFGKKALILTGENISKAGLVDEVMKPLKKEGVEVDVFSHSHTHGAEPDLEEIDLVIEAARKNEYELFIGVGGGSCMDMAKLASIMTTNPGGIQQYLSVGETLHRDDLVKKPGPPIVLVNTTHEAGGEIGHAIILHTKKRKVYVKSPYAVPKVAIIDPMLTVTLPRSVTAATCLDALATAIETYTTIYNTPLSDVLSLFSIKLVSDNLAIAYGDGRNIEARYNLSLAGHIAGLANYSVGASHLIHAFSHAIGGMWGITHGFACSVTMPYILNTITKMIPKPRLVRLAKAFGENPERLTKNEIASRIVMATKRLNEDVNSPGCLKDVGAKKNELPEMVKQALDWKHYIDRSPWKLTYDDAIKLAERIWEGIILV